MNEWLSLRTVISTNISLQNLPNGSNVDLFECMLKLYLQSRKRLSLYPSLSIMPITFSCLSLAGVVNKLNKYLCVRYVQGACAMVKADRNASITIVIRAPPALALSADTYHSRGQGQGRLVRTSYRPSAADIWRAIRAEAVSWMKHIHLWKFSIFCIEFISLQKYWALSKTVYKALLNDWIGFL